MYYTTFIKGLFEININLCKFSSEGIEVNYAIFEHFCDETNPLICTFIDIEGKPP